MKIVFDFAQGKLTHEEFELELSLDPEIWTWVQALVPEDIDSPDCGFRSLYGNMKGFETNHYKVKSTILSFGYNGHLAHSLISALIKYHYPNIVSQSPPDHSDAEILDKLKMDYIGGSEVDDLIADILLDFRGKKNKEIKKALSDAFPCATKRIPQWVQEPEWPVCNGVPMRFIKQENDGDLFQYLFEDIKTGEQRTISQYA